MEKLIPEQEIDELTKGYTSYVRYTDCQKDHVDIRKKLEFLRCQYRYEPHNLSGGGIGYNIRAEGQNATIFLYPDVAIVEIPINDRIVIKDGILSLSEFDTKLLNAVEEEYAESPGKSDEDIRILKAKFAIAVGKVFKVDPWHMYLVSVLVDIAVNERYWQIT